MRTACVCIGVHLCDSQKPHRLLPTNLYVVLYNFKARHPDELDLKAGYKVFECVTIHTDTPIKSTLTINHAVDQHQSYKRV